MRLKEQRRKLEAVDVLHQCAIRYCLGDRVEPPARDTESRFGVAAVTGKALPSLRHENIVVHRSQEGQALFYPQRKQPAQQVQDALHARPLMRRWRRIQQNHVLRLRQGWGKRGQSFRHCLKLDYDALDPAIEVCGPNNVMSTSKRRAALD